MSGDNFKTKSKDRQVKGKKETLDVRDLSPIQIPRVGVFQPTRRPVAVSRIYKTKWGCFEVNGRLGQAHEDFLEVAIKYALKKEIIEGCLCISIDLSQIRKALSKTEGRASFTQTIKICEDLRTVQVIRKDETEKSTTFSGIISVHGFSKATKDDKSKTNKTSIRCRDGQIHYYKIKFSESWTKLLLDTLTTEYRGKLLEILTLRNGITQAVARFMLTHKPGARYRIIEVFSIVCISGRTSDRMRELLSEKNKLLEMGIAIEDAVLVS